MHSSSVSTVIGAVEIGGHDIVIMVHLTVQHRALSPRDARVCNEDVETAIKLFDDLVDHLLDVLLVLDIDLVCGA